jgi:hypothetical protein
VDSSEKIVAAIDRAKDSGAQALNFLSSPLFTSNRHIIIQHVIALRLPSIHHLPETPAPNSFWERSSVQKDAMAEPIEANNRTGVPSSGAEAIGRRSGAIMVARHGLRVSYAQRH